jgi:3-methyladenine DNA glycosylase/8-oxoguanine DNA glycosylase
MTSESRPTRFRLTVPVPFRLEAVVRTHGWVELAPWRWDGETLARRERIGRAAGELSIRQSAPDRLAVSWHPHNGGVAPGGAAIRAAVARALSWDWDHAPFLAAAATLDPGLHALVAGGAGRFLRGTSFYEDFLKTVCTINTTWASTERMSANLVAEIGRGAFPTPRQVLAFGEDALRARCRLGFRAPVVIRCTQRLLADKVMSLAGHGDPTALGYDYLLSLPGIGPYAAAHCRVLLHDFAHLPIDTVMTAHLRDVIGITDGFVEHFAAWGEHAFLGYQLKRVAMRLAE